MDAASDRETFCLSHSSMPVWRIGPRFRYVNAVRGRKIPNCAICVSTSGGSRHPGGGLAAVYGSRLGGSAVKLMESSRRLTKNEPPSVVPRGSTPV